MHLALVFEERKFSDLVEVLVAPSKVLLYVVDPEKLNFSTLATCNLRCSACIVVSLMIYGAASPGSVELIDVPSTGQVVDEGYSYNSIEIDHLKITSYLSFPSSGEMHRVDAYH